MKQNLIQQAQENTAQPATQQEGLTFKDFIERNTTAITAALPPHVSKERFLRLILNALNENPELAKTTRQSFLKAVLRTAQYGLEIGTQVFLLPFKDHKKGTLECQFVLSYKGLLELAYRSPKMKIIQVHTVYSNDEFDYSYGINPKLTHVPAKGNRGIPAFFYAIIQLTTGGVGFEVMSLEEVQEFKKKECKDTPVWREHFDEMAMKTVLKKALKFAPLQAEINEIIYEPPIAEPEHNENILPSEDVVEIQAKEQGNLQAAKNSLEALPEPNINEDFFKDEIAKEQEREAAINALLEAE